MRPSDDDRGFTLIELMVVVLIIAVLLAIAIPTYLGARQRAEDRAAQSHLRSALVAAKAIFADGDTFANLTETELTLANPDLVFVSGATNSVGPKQVSWAVPSGATLQLAALSKSGRCFYLRETTTMPGGGVFYASRAVGPGNCAALVGVASGSDFDQPVAAGSPA